MIPAHWYRNCPTCGGSFGRGKGANGLARHSDDPEVLRVACLYLRRLVRAAAIGHGIIEARLKKKLRDRDDRLDVLRRLLLGGVPLDFVAGRRISFDNAQMRKLARVLNLRKRDWKAKR